jgi:hypothetical protein
MLELLQHRNFKIIFCRGELDKGGFTQPHNPSSANIACESV